MSTIEDARYDGEIRGRRPLVNRASAGLCRYRTPLADLPSAERSAEVVLSRSGESGRSCIEEGAKGEIDGSMLGWKMYPAG